jgi:hypothetical protein
MHKTWFSNKIVRILIFFICFILHSCSTLKIDGIRYNKSDLAKLTWEEREYMMSVLISDICNLTCGNCNSHKRSFDSYWIKPGLIGISAKIQYVDYHPGPKYAHKSKSFKRVIFKAEKGKRYHVEGSWDIAKHHFNIADFLESSYVYVKQGDYIVSPVPVITGRSEKYKLGIHPDLVEPLDNELRLLLYK